MEDDGDVGDDGLAVGLAEAQPRLEDVPGHRHDLLRERRVLRAHLVEQLGSSATLTRYYISKYFVCSIYIYMKGTSQTAWQTEGI